MKNQIQPASTLRLVMLLLAVGGPPAWGAAQDKAAEDAFKKIQDSIEKAKTVLVRYKFEGQANQQKLSGSGAIFIKEGNRARVEMAMTSGDQEVTSLMVSDGKKTRLRNSMGRMAGPDESDTPPDFGVVLKHNLAHSCSSLSGHPSAIKDPLKALSFSEFAGGEGEKGTKTLSYKASDAQASLSMKVWYDPKTFRILKRTMEVKAAEVSATISEILEEYSFDADIPDDRFDTSLPATAEEKAAEAVFKRIRESLEKAKTVRIRFATEESMFGENHTFSGTVLLKEGNRARLETKASFRGKEGSSLILSNGKILRGTTSNAAMDLWIPPDVPEQDTPANLGILIRGSLVHSSLSAGGLFKEGLAREGEESKNAALVSEFRDAADEKGIRTLSYKLTDRSGWPTQIRLWYDPATLKLTKRSMIHRSPHSGFAFKETLEEFVLDGEIPDASFILAAGPARAAVGGLIAETGDAVPAPDRSLDPLPKGSRARLGSPDLRYDNFVFLSDGKGVASIAKDGTVHFWDLVSGAVTRRFRLPGPGKVLALSPGARRAAWSEEGGRIQLVDLEPGKASLPLEGSSAKEFRPSNVDFSPDGALLATSSPAKDVLLWDSASGKRLHKLQAPRGALRFLAFSPDGTLLAAEGPDHAVICWETATAKERGRVAGHGDQMVSSAAFSPDGKTLLTGGHDGRLRVWDVSSGRALFVPDCNPLGTFSPDGTTIITQARNRGLLVWDVATGRELRRVGLGSDNDGVTVFSPDGRFFATRVGGGAVVVFEAASAKQLVTLAGSGAAFSRATATYAFSPDGRLIVMSSGPMPPTDENHRSKVRIWEAASGREIVHAGGHREAVTSVSFAPDGKSLASASRDGSVRLWDATTGRELLRLEGHGGPVSCVAVSPDGKTLASGTWGEIILWDAVNWRSRAVSVPPRGGAEGLAFSPDGKSLFSNRLYVLDVATGKPVLIFQGQQAPGAAVVAYSPDGRHLMARHMYDRGQDAALRVWDASTGKEAMKIPELAWSKVLALSPEGRTLACFRETLETWDAATWKKRAAFPRPEYGRAVLSLAFSPDAKTLVSGSEDGALTLWDPETGKELRQLQSRGAGVDALAFSPDGKSLAAAMGDSTILIWNLSPEAARSEIPSRGETAARPREIDVLQLVDPAKAAGDWRLDEGKLISPEQSDPWKFHIFWLPLIPPAEYDVTIVAARRGGTSSLDLGLTVAGIPRSAVLDGWDGICALQSADGRGGPDKETSKLKRLFTDDQPRTVVYSVRRTGVTVTAEGKTVIQWSGDPGWPVRARELYLGSWSPFEVRKMVLTPVSGTATILLNKAGPAPVPPRSQPKPSGSLATREGPVGHWKFDEESGTRAADSSGAGNEGTLKNGAAWVKGREGQAIKLDGTRDFVQVEGGETLNFAANAAFTVSAWIRTSKNYGAILSFRNLSREGPVIDLTVGYDGIQTTEGALMGHVRQDNGSGGYARVTGGTVNDGKWHFATMTRNHEGLIELFLDGVSQGTNKGAESAGPITTDLRALGCERKWVQVGWGDVEKRYYEGLLDDVRIYNRLLLPDEIRALASGTAKAAAAAPSDGRPWRAIFDGKTTDFMNPVSAGFWTVQDGALSLTSGSRDSAQTRESFGDGEIRIRFEAKDVPYGAIAVRQGAEGRYAYLIDRTVCAALGAGPHEIVFTCRGEEVKAMLDGKPAAVQAEGGRPKAGQIQFGGNSSGLRILAIEYRDLSK